MNKKRSFNAASDSSENLKRRKRVSMDSPSSRSRCTPSNISSSDSDDRDDSIGHYQGIRGDIIFNRCKFNRKINKV